MRPPVHAIAALVLSAPPPLSHAQTPSRAQLVARIDSIMQAPIAAGRVVGASIAVVKGRDTIAVRQYGKANIELGVNTPPNAIYEIGSITKQFTGAAVMQLVEQGKLSLDDDVSKLLPNFNATGHKITLRRLLDHSSGIKGYTEMPVARTLFPFDLPRDTLLRLIEKAPYDFEPGEEQIYNNSAFFLVGLIIERATGMSYGDYVQQHLFAPAGMKSSHYCSETAVRPNKTSGYDWDASGPIQKRPISHKWPFAAGSLCSTALDLVAWNETLHRTNTLMSAASYKTMTTPETLNDGAPLGYANGLAFTPIAGHRSIHHGCGINGWTTENDYFPDDSLSVVVLYNDAGPAGPADAAEAIAAAVLGRIPLAAKPVDGDINRFAGTYTGRGRGAAATMVISVENGALNVARGGQKRPLTYTGGGVFVLGSTRFVFTEAGGKVATLRVDSGAGNNVLRPRAGG